MLRPSLLDNNNCVHIFVSTVHRQSCQCKWCFYTMLSLHHTPSHCTRQGMNPCPTRDIVLQHHLCTASYFLLKKIGNKPAMKWPQLISLTATMPISYLPLLSHLLTIPLSLVTPSSAVVWSILPTQDWNTELHYFQQGSVCVKGFVYCVKKITRQSILERCCSLQFR